MDELAESAPAAPALECCPLIGLVDDRSARRPEPCEEHRCYAGDEPLELEERTQLDLCLQSQYRFCPRYLRSNLVLEPEPEEPPSRWRLVLGDAADLDEDDSALARVEALARALGSAVGSLPAPKRPSLPASVARGLAWLRRQRPDASVPPPAPNGAHPSAPSVALPAPPGPAEPGPTPPPTSGRATPPAWTWTVSAASRPAAPRTDASPQPGHRAPATPRPPEACPLLGREDGRLQCEAQPSYGHRCFAVKPAVFVDLATQRGVCLYAAHLSCPRYLRSMAMAGRR